LFDRARANASIAAQHRRLSGVMTTGAAFGEDFFAVRLAEGKCRKEQ